jgi:hypothetical protein
MGKYTVNKTVKLTEIQNNTLNKLKTVYKINTQQFIRDAIAEKIKRDYSKIKVKNKKEYCPF